VVAEGEDDPEPAKAAKRIAPTQARMKRVENFISAEG
jgi:hypothetical protein